MTTALAAIVGALIGAGIALTFLAAWALSGKWYE